MKDTLGVLRLTHQLASGHSKFHVTGESTAARRDRNVAAGRPDRHSGRDRCTRGVRGESAALPLKLTLLAPVNSFPRIVTAVPISPDVGRVTTNAPRPKDKLNTVP